MDHRVYCSKDWGLELGLRDLRFSGPPRSRHCTWLREELDLP